MHPHGSIQRFQTRPQRLEPRMVHGMPITVGEDLRPEGTELVRRSVQLCDGCIGIIQRK